jgi:hypothetical protein
MRSFEQSARFTREKLKHRGLENYFGSAIFHGHAERLTEAGAHYLISDLRDLRI